MPAPYSKFDLRLDSSALAGDCVARNGMTPAAARIESTATVLLVVAVLSAGLISGLLVVWRSLV